MVHDDGEKTDDSDCEIENIPCIREVRITLTQNPNPSLYNEKPYENGFGCF